MGVGVTDSVLSRCKKAVFEAPLMKEIILDFKSAIQFENKVTVVKEHCQKFLNSFTALIASCDIFTDVRTVYTYCSD